jgi:hypothetical protein
MAITGTLHEDQYAFLSIPRSILLRMRNVSDKVHRENQNTHCIPNIFFFENLAVYDIMWKNIVEPGRQHVTKRRIRTACCTPKATTTSTEYVIFNACPLQQWLYERISTLRYTYIAALGKY